MSESRFPRGRWQTMTVLLFFGAYLILGLAVFGDYGVSWDEPVSRTRGVLTLQYVVQGNTELLDADWRYHHGAFFDTALVAIEAILQLTADARAVYLMRHLVTFLLFYSCVFTFYLLCKRRFQSWKIGLLGSLFLIASPRIFAHSFYNPKDIPFLALFVISIYTLLRFLENKTAMNSVVHALACALLIDVRVLGAIVPLSTLAFLAIDFGRAVNRNEADKKRITKRVMVSALVAIVGLTVLALLLATSSFQTVMQIAKSHPFLANSLFAGVILGIPAWLRVSVSESAGKRIAGTALLYIFLLSVLVTLFWPILWRNPIYEFTNATLLMKSFPWPYTVLYIGKYFAAAKLPWHYIPVWIGISTPLLYLALAVIGSFTVMKALCTHPLKCLIDRREDCLFAIWLFVPLAAGMGLKSVLYDEWRQLYFIYPAMIIFALLGMMSVLEYSRKRFTDKVFRQITWVAAALIVAGIVIPAVFMVRNHPYQNVYFNRLAGGNGEAVRNNFELDYWGASYRMALEHILLSDPGKTIKVCVANYPGKANANILPARDRNRLVYVDEPGQAEYYLSNYRWHREEYEYGQEYFSVKVDGIKIMVVYKI